MSAPAPNASVGGASSGAGGATAGSAEGNPPQHGGNAAEALRQRYRRACEERRVTPIAPLLRLLDGLVPTKHNAVTIHSLHLRGSQPELFSSRVSYNQLDALTETLKGVCPMHTLDLSYNFIDDTGAKLIAEFLRETSVKVVNVSGNDIGAAGMLSIAEAASQGRCRGMQELLVSGNLFGLEGAKALASLISSSDSLLVLNLKGCGIGLDGLIHITAALSSPLSSGLSSCSTTSTSSLSADTKQQQDHTTATTTVTATTAPASAADAAGNMMSANGSHLAGGESSSGGDMMMASAASIDGSTSGRNGDTNATANTHDNAHSNVNTNDGGNSDAGCCTLEVLNFEDILQPGVQQEQAVHIAKMLASNSRLKELYIGKTGFRDLGCSTLVEYGLLRNNALTKLDLRCNQITLESGPVLNRLIRENNTLTSLNLSHNRLGDEGCAAIARALPLNTTISHLDVSSNRVGEAGLVELARNIGDSDVVHVCCRGNTFSSDAGEAFLELIDSKARRGDIVLLDIKPQKIDGKVMVAVDNNNI